VRIFERPATPPPGVRRGCETACNIAFSRL
jgi:hypothetical protein